MAKQKIVEYRIVSGQREKFEYERATFEDAKIYLQNWATSWMLKAEEKGIGMKVDIAPTWRHAVIHLEGGDKMILDVVEIPEPTKTEEPPTE